MSDAQQVGDAPWWPLLEQVSDGVVLLAPEPWRIVGANSAIAGWLSKSALDLQEKPLEEIFKPSSSEKIRKLAMSVGGSGPSSAAMIARLSSDDEAIDAVDVRFCRLRSSEPALVGLIVRRTANERRKDAATNERRDPLTGLPDREFLMRRLAALLRGVRAADRQFAVLFIDLDNFKQVNDAHGHLLGDRVLREVAQRLATCVREGDQVARFGGDEFVVLVERVTNSSDIEPVVRRIEATLAEPVELPHGEFMLSLSIGVAEPTPDHHSAEDLVEAADRAMYAVKRLPR